MRTEGAQQRSPAAAGFTLIEVILTLGILMSLTIAVASMLRSGFDVKEGLSEKARVIHRLSVSMEKLANDVQSAFYVSVKDAQRNGIDRNMKTVFKLEKSGMNGDKLSLTTMTHKAMLAGAYESEFTFVTYELKDAKEAPGRKDLYRAETPVVPLDLKEQPPERLLARNIKTMNLQFWTGEKWSTDSWDTGRGDSRNRLPKLFRITFEAWSHDRKDGDGQDAALTDEATQKLSTVVYIENSGEYQELKEQNKTINWGTM